MYLRMSDGLEEWHSGRKRRESGLDTFLKVVWLDIMLSW